MSERMTSTTVNPTPTDSSHATFTKSRREFFDRRSDRIVWGRYYHGRLISIYKNLIPPGERVLELGCGTGDLLAALEPAHGVGVDFSGKAVEAARRKHPSLHFIESNVDDLELSERFDVIIQSDLVNDVWDIQRLLTRCAALCHPGTRIIFNFYSRLWQIPLTIVRRMGLAKPVLDQNWITVEDLENFLRLSGFESMRHWSEIIWPLGMPLLAALLNKYLVRFPPFSYLALTNLMIARPRPSERRGESVPSVSVVVPARNEAGNIENIIRRIPEMGSHTEIIFAEGGSSDGTYEAIKETISKYPQRDIKLFKQTGRGKGDAVRLGFAQAGGEVLMILDADLTVTPEDLPRFYDALVAGRGEFINGVRLVYPMEDRAMRFFNLLGNKFFTLAFSFLLGQNIKDTLCGTKVLWKSDYERIVANRHFFGDFDPFGDFDLIFGAAKLNLKITDMPIRYRQRVYGETNIQRWTHGWLLLKMVLFVARKIKFV